MIKPKLWKLKFVPVVKKVGNKEVVEFNGLRFHRNPFSKHLQYKNYFWAYKDEKALLLHRCIWEKFKGPIPKGHIVHHVDENPLNNSLSNLDCIPLPNHISLHANDSKRLARCRETIKIAQKVAQESGCQQTAEARKNYSVAAKKRNQSYPLRKIQCVECGDIYETRFPGFTQHCKKQMCRIKDWARRNPEKAKARAEKHRLYMQARKLKAQPNV